MLSYNGREKNVVSDKNGRIYARHDELEPEVSFIQADGHFSCLPPGAVSLVFDDPKGLFVFCTQGKHYLCSQLADDSDHLIGFYPV